MKNKNKFEINNINQKINDMIEGSEEDFAHWLLHDAKKYGVKGRKYR